MVTSSHNFCVPTSRFYNDKLGTMTAVTAYLPFPWLPVAHCQVHEYLGEYIYQVVCQLMASSHWHAAPYDEAPRLGFEGPPPRYAVAVSRNRT